MTFAAPLALALASTLLQPTAASLPDFSGTWTLDEGRSDSARQEKFVSPMVVVISRADAATLVVETRRGDQVEVTKFTIEVTPERPGAIGAGTRRAYWDGPKLVTEGAGNLQGQTVSIRSLRTLNATATEMTVESTVAVQHGYTLRGAQTYALVKDVYTRSAK
jgi:hypothetical protein